MSKKQVTKKKFMVLKREIKPCVNMDCETYSIAIGVFTDRSSFTYREEYIRVSAQRNVNPDKTKGDWYAVRIDCDLNIDRPYEHEHAMTLYKDVQKFIARIEKTDASFPNSIVAILAYLKSVKAEIYSESTMSFDDWYSAKPM